MGQDDNPKYILASAITFPILTMILVSLRFYARRKHGAGYGPDDWFALLAVVSFIYNFLEILLNRITNES